MARILTILFTVLVCCLQTIAFKAKGIRWQRNRCNNLKMAIDFPLIPTIIGTAGLVFAAFNIPENKIDLTDKGIAIAKMKRRQERIDRGELPKSKEGLDPYRYRIFEEDDEEIDIESIGKSKGGGCG